MKRSLRFSRMTMLACALMGGSAYACTTRPLPPTALPDKLDLPKASRVTQAWSCKDKLGEQLVLATLSSTGQAVHASETETELTFLKFRQTAIGWKRDWQARDFLHEQPSQHANELILLGDYDGDGQADVFLAYAIHGLSAEPDEGKLLVFYKDQKYAIRGAVARTPNDFGSRKLSANFLTLPKAIQSQAFKLWDKLNSPHH